jgi:2-keto-4-pentenoate hydratase
MQFDYEKIAASFLQAEETRTPIKPVSTTYPGLTTEDAYRVQHALVAKKVEQGAAIVGWKIGATNTSIQVQLGLDEPVYGHLLSDRQIPSGGHISLSKGIHPRIECEIAFQMETELAGPGVSELDVLQATAAVLPALEINDPRTIDWQVGKLEVIADNGLGAGFVVGDPFSDLTKINLGEIGVVFLRNGREFARAKGEVIMGDPLRAVVWLANKLSERGLALEAGQIILSGSLTPIAPVETGDVYEASFDHLGSVDVVFDD